MNDTIQASCFTLLTFFMLSSALPTISWQQPHSYKYDSIIDPHLRLRARVNRHLSPRINNSVNKESEALVLLFLSVIKSRGKTFLTDKGRRFCFRSL